MKKNVLHPSIACEACRSRENSLLSALCSAHLKTISESKSCTVYKRGQILFHEGTRPLGVFCINQGKVKIYKLGYNGKEHITTIAHDGGLLGYKALIAQETYSVSAETLEDCTICFLPKTSFLQTLQESSEFNQQIMKQVCSELGVMTESLVDLAQRTVRERLAITLLKLKDTYGMDAHEEGAIEINLTRDDLANMVGTATETLIRLLQEFKADCLISTQGRKIRIENPSGLARVANLH